MRMSVTISISREDVMRAKKKAATELVDLILSELDKQPTGALRSSVGYLEKGDQILIMQGTNVLGII